jgi:hypothetical protein
VIAAPHMVEETFRWNNLVQLMTLKTFFRNSFQVITFDAAIHKYFTFRVRISQQHVIR